MKHPIILLLNVLLIFMPRLETRNLFMFDRLEVCDNAPDSPYDYLYMNMRIINHQTYVDSEFILRRDILKIRIETKIQRCLNKEMLDSCEYIMSLNTKNVCPLMKQNDTMFAGMLNTFKPLYRCPLKKGRYVQRNGTVDPDLMKFMYLGDYYWKIKIISYDGVSNKYMTTSCYDGKVITVRD